MEDITGAIPAFTLTYIVSSAVLAATVSYNYISPHLYTMELSGIMSGQIWRLITAFIYTAPFSGKFFFHFIFSYQN